MTKQASPGTGDHPPQRLSHDWFQVVQEQVDALKFGSVEITVHDSRVVQVQRTEKVRLDPSR